MKKILLLLLPFFFSSAFSQVTMKAIVNKKNAGFNEGDTAVIYGFTKSAVDNSEEFIIKKNGDYKTVSASKYNVIQPIADFWEKLWFYNRSRDIMLNGWDIDLRTRQTTDSREFVQNLQTNKLLLDDDYVQDYLSQMIHNICPKKIPRPKDSYLTISIMKSNESQSFSFSNGTIVVTTSLLANLKTEQELVKVLSKEIANIVLDHNILNMKQQIKAQRAANFWTAFAAVASTAAAVSSASKGNYNFTFDDAIVVTAATSLISSSIMESVGANYSLEQTSSANTNAQIYVKTEYPKWEQKTQDDYTRVVSSIITYTAWQHYYAFNYTEAIAFINRLENAGVAVEDDYLLKAKIYRALYNTDEANYEALRCIHKAKSLGNTKLIDLSKEEGLLYLRLDNKEKAKAAFDEYKSGLEELQAKGDDSSASELQWLKGIMLKNNL
jgi:hypothetical protein